MVRRAMGMVFAVSLMLIASGCWYEAGWEPGRSNFNPFETAIGSSNVGALTPHWQSSCVDPFNFPSISPSVANPSVFLAAANCGAGGQPELVSLSESTGQQNWATTLSGFPSTPAVGDGIYGGSGLVFTTYNTPAGVGVLEAFTAATGAPAWQVTLPGVPIGSVTLAASPAAGLVPSGVGLLFVSTFTGQVVLVSTSGAVLQTSAVGPYDTDVAVGNGLVYVGGLDGSLTVLHEVSLTVAWTAKVSSVQAVFATPVVSGTTVYGGADDGTVAAFTASNGTPLWSDADLGAFLFEPPAVANNQVFVTVSLNGPPAPDQFTLYALDTATGHVNWTFADGTMEDQSPMVANGLVYAGTTADVDAVDLTGHLVTRIPALPVEPPVVSDGLLIIPEGDHVRALGP